LPDSLISVKAALSRFALLNPIISSVFISNYILKLIFLNK